MVIVPFGANIRPKISLFGISIRSIGVGGSRVVQIIDSVYYFSSLHYSAVLIVFLLTTLLFLRITKRIVLKKEIIKQKQDEINKLRTLRDKYKHDISGFIQAYNNDVYKKLDQGEENNGVFVFWNDAENIIEKFVCKSSEISNLPSKEERIAIRSFYTEAKALVDGIIYNNYLLKKYQKLRCRIKTTTATTAEINEVDNITKQMSLLGEQLRQQHQELITSLNTAKVYF